MNDKDKKYFRDYYKKNKIKHISRTKRWRDNNLDKARKYAREYAKSHPLEQRNQWLKRNYGISLEAYNVIFDTQNGKCAICEYDCDIKRTLSVDHNHANGKVRGLLCHKCNTAIGFLGEDIKRIENVITYLKKHTN